MDGFLLDALTKKTKREGGDGGKTKRRHFNIECLLKNLSNSDKSF
jgi:hypothetical protein